ncbi:hypothetical protein JCM1840_002215 [Sporobolomyces johnsonii]
MQPQPLERNYGRWMATLPDSVSLDSLYLPGTHESLAHLFPLLGSTCQSLPLPSQLSLGIRFLDFRFRLDRKGELWAWHGSVPQWVNAERAFGDIYAWLDGEGAGEAVVVSCKQEDHSHPLFAATLWALLDRHPSKWYDQDRWPSLGEVRGKCVMFCRFGFESGRGLHPVSWPDNQSEPWSTSIGGREVVVQDWYNIASPLRIPEKASLALSLFDPSSPALSSSSSTAYPRLSPNSTSTPDSPRESESLPLRINFLSAYAAVTAPPSLCAKGLVGLFQTSPAPSSSPSSRPSSTSDSPSSKRKDDDSRRRFPWPRLRLKGINERVLDALNEEGSGPGRRREAGQGGMVVLMDFCASPERGRLVRRVVELNFA